MRRVREEGEKWTQILCGFKPGGEWGDVCWTNLYLHCSLIPLGLKTHNTRRRERERESNQSYLLYKARSVIQFSFFWAILWKRNLYEGLMYGSRKQLYTWIQMKREERERERERRKSVDIWFEVWRGHFDSEYDWESHVVPKHWRAGTRTEIWEERLERKKKSTWLLL